MNSTSRKSVRTTLKNTGLVGGSKFIGVLISIVRGKFIAILLGPSGMGLVQLFQSSIAIVRSVSGLGIGFSGVRDIAQSVSTGDGIKISQTIITLKRWSWVTGVLGVLVTVLMSKQLSIWTFGDDTRWLEISILSSTILMANLAAGFNAVIRGSRRMKDFAKISILSSLIGSIIAIIVYYFYGIKGIVPVLMFTALSNLIFNIYYSKKIKTIKVDISYKDSFNEGLDMVKLGIFTMLTGFILQLSMYYVKISINDNLGTDSVGFYGVATTLAVTYMGLIFSAMGADYFPKLSAINKDNIAINKAVIEQSKIILLLGTPLVIGMYTFSEYLIQILYTKDFILALPLLMWMLLSVFLRLIGFPIGYVFLAKGEKTIFIFTQSLWNIVFVSLVFLSWRLRGDLIGVGIAFTVSYAIGVLTNIIIIKRLTKFSYDTETIVYIITFSIITIIYFLLSFHGFNLLYVFVLKFFVLTILTLFCIKRLERLVDINILELVRSKFFKK